RTLHSFPTRRSSDLNQPRIAVRAKPGISNMEMKDELTGILRSSRRLAPGAEDNFALNETSVLSKGFDGLFDVIGTVGWIIGGFRSEEHTSELQSREN